MTRLPSSLRAALVLMLAASICVSVLSRSLVSGQYVTQTVQTPAAILTLSPREQILVAATIDSGAGFGYFVTAPNLQATPPQPSVIVKIRLSDFTRVGTLVLSPEMDVGYGAQVVIDSTAGFMYFVPGTTNGVVVKIRLSDFTVVTERTLECCFPFLAIIDPNGFGYFGSSRRVVKMRMSNLTEVDTMNLDPDIERIESAVIDTVNDFAYFGTSKDDVSPSKILKVDLSSFTINSTLTLSAGEVIQRSAPANLGIGPSLIDVSNGYAYFVLQQTEAELFTRLMKVRLRILQGSEH